MKCAYQYHDALSGRDYRCPNCGQPEPEIYDDMRNVVSIETRRITRERSSINSTTSGGGTAPIRTVTGRIWSAVARFIEWLYS